MKYNQLINESGFLTPLGKKWIDDKVLPNIIEILNDMETENQMQIVGGVLSKQIGDTIADKLLERAQRRQFLVDMSDEEFETHLKNKYGDNYTAITLTKEELERVFKIEKIKKALEEGLKAREEALKVVPSHTPLDLKFK